MHSLKDLKNGELTMSHFVIKDRYVIPSFLARAIASWVVSLAGISVVLLIVYLVSVSLHQNILTLIPGPLRVLLDVVGAYAGIGGICLYVTMWIYWIGIQRSPIAARIGWLMALIFLLHYGALIYAIVVWRNEVVKCGGSQVLQNLPTGDAS
jgi:hypothetical protein